jgi:vancomycin resistance protein YoaR
MKKKKKAIIIILLLVILGVSGFYGYMHSYTNKWTSLVYPGVKIEEVDISGKTLSEATDMITKKYEHTILTKNINIKTPLKTYSLNYAKLNARYNIEEVVATAFNYGKNLKLYDKYNLIRKPESKVLNLKFVYDQKPVKLLISNIKKELDIAPVNGSITINQGYFEIKSDLKGYKIMGDKLEKEILSKINGDIKSPDINVEAEVVPILANITKEKLQTVNKLLSSFSSNFTSSAYGRSTNITLAVKSINGTLVMPGQSFSFNGTVGRRTAAKGYQPAPVDIGTKVGSDYGGGICQVSTSLYNSIIRTNIKSTERRYHSIPSTYIPLGMDATVDWGNLDYKFTNTLKFPIYIEGIVKNKILTFNIYSNTSLSDKSYNLVNDIYESMSPGPTQYIEDNTMLIGQTIQEQFPLIGYKVRVYKDTIQNGMVIEHELISDDHYKKVAEVIRIGTKKN